jgi:4'-phosphopantetheinyl transferase EntD
MDETIRRLQSFDRNYDLLIGTLCPPGTAVVAGPGGPDAALFPEEEPAVATAIERRRLQFTQGRSYAREALRRLGADVCAIPMRPDRAPGWPNGVVGTISHTDGLVCAAVAWRHTVGSLGIDVESRIREISPKLDRFIRTPRERETSELPADFDALRVVFSAKESIHKCVHPLSGITLGFQDVELQIDVDAGTFRPHLVRPREGLPDFSLIVGRFAMTDDFVVSASWILASRLAAPVLPESSTPNS